MPYLAALGLTLLVEVPVVVWVAGWYGVSRARAAVVAVVASLVTHPLLWFGAAPHLGGLGGLLAAEVGVVGIEAAVYRLLLRPRVRVAVAVGLAVLSNALSFGVGVALW